VRPPELLTRGPKRADDEKLIEQVVERNRSAAIDYFEQLKIRLPTDAEAHVLVDFDVTSALHEFVAQYDIDLVLSTAHGYSGHTQRPYGAVATDFVMYGTTSLLVLQDVPKEARVPALTERLFAEVDLLERTRIHTGTQPEAIL
jgi:nucleotide-binding universal stress UspA family protein